jgi:serine/threonine protein phosphatase PrpC
MPYWQAPSPPLIDRSSVLPLISVYTEKLSGLGEDAPPLLASTPDEAHVCVGVFDGLGGSGAVKYDLGPRAHTGAYCASRLVSWAVQQAFTSDPSLPTDKLRAQIDADLGRFDERLGAPRSRLRSPMLKVLPTTLAVAVVTSHRAGAPAAVRCISAGDSRVYRLTPSVGLSQLTQDDLASKGDALTNLLHDSRMSNCISLESEYALHQHTYSCTEPTLVIAATDGCFAYLQSPMHFEDLLLGSLAHASSARGWEDALHRIIKRTAQDDATLAIVAHGFDSDRSDVFALVKEAFATRLQELRTKYIDPLATARSMSREAFVTLREILWASYSAGYYPADEAATAPGGTA